MLPFAQTSHARKWVFSAEQLRAQRAAANGRAARLVSDAHEVGGETVEPLSCDEERLLVCKFLTVELPTLCAHERVRADERLRTLAALYFARVYARHSLMELVGGGCLDPRVSMATCVLIAAKVEEAKDLDAAVLEGAAHVGRQLILALEPDVLAALDYDLCAHLPAVALDGLLGRLDEERRAPRPRARARAAPAPKAEPGVDGAAADGDGDDADDDGDDAARLRDACVAHVLGPALRADGLLTHSPQQLALAALYASAPSADGAALDVGGFVDRHFAGLRDGAAAAFAPVRALLRAAEAAPAVDAPELARCEGLYHRLKLCHQRLKLSAQTAEADRGAGGGKRRLGDGDGARGGDQAAGGDAEDAGPQAKLAKVEP